MDSSLLFIDFETFYDTASKYTLDQRKGGVSILEYIRDKRFKVHGVGMAINDGPVFWDDGQYLMSNSPHFVVVGHNVRFDGFILKNHYNIQPLAWIDTKAMARAVLGKKVKDYSLKTLAEYFNLPAKGTMRTNGIRDLTPEQEKELAEYCLHDVWLCREIYKRLEPMFPKSQYFFMNQTIQMFVEPKLVLNTALLEKTAYEEAKRKETIFEEIGIEKAEFASNKKFPILLVNRGYEVPSKTSPRTHKTIPAIALGDPEFIEMKETENEELKRLIEARIAAKSNLLETRSAKLASISKTGLWAFDIEFSGATQTHRYSGGNGAGGNPQNFTRDSALRQAVEASAGYKLVVGDFAQIEARLQAYLSKDPGLIQAFEKGDPYCDFASSFYQRQITKADKIERKFGKTAILGLGYGMGAERFKLTVKRETGLYINDKEAKKAVDLYRMKYFKIPQLWRDLQEHIVMMTTDKKLPCKDLPVTFIKNAVILPSGLQIQYPNLRQEGKEWVYDIYKQGHLVKEKLYGGKVLENICQALTGELCKAAMAPFKDIVVGQVHDEIILLVSDKEANDKGFWLKGFMEQSPEWLPQIKLKAEVGIGQTWQEAKKVAK